MRHGGLRGFTLVEILVVVVILGITATLALPMMSTSSVKLSSAAQVVMSDLMYAQNYAITHQTYVYVAFCSSKNYRVYTWNGVGRPDDTSAVPTTSSDSRIVPGPNGSPMWVNLGTSASSEPLRSVLLQNVSGTGCTALDGGSRKYIGFDSFGQTWKYDGTVQTGIPTVRLSTGRTSSSPAITLRVQPYTGEISVQ
jgi:prepilin-type N-terminal cleavage/methylation domain-containing protein